MARKGLKFNLSKSMFLVHNDEKKTLDKKLEESPLMLCGEKMQRASEVTYLGEQISALGVGASAKATVAKRFGRAKQLIFEIRAIIEDYRYPTIPALSSALPLLLLRTVAGHPFRNHPQIK